MTGYPLRHAVAHEVFVMGGRDELGNDVQSFADPVSVQVYGWAPAGRGDDGEPKRAGRDAFVVVDLELYTPSGFKPGARDRIVVDGERFDVIGPVEEYSHGFHGWEGGNVVNLRRSEG